MNGEAKHRRKTRAVVLGKAKVMNFEELAAKRAERDAKEQAKAEGKGKRGRKPKTAPEAEDTAGKGKPGRKRKSAASEAGMLESGKAKAARIELPEPSTAPVARMSDAQDTASATVEQMSEAQEHASKP
jgi:hypothetical protein